jgi:Protein of unknown function (DUF2924)
MPPAGTVLERFYRGQPIRVTVLENGFAYYGKSYGSLSAIVIVSPARVGTVFIFSA